MRFLSILVKPVSGLCNMDCSYCFYRELAEALPHQNQMSTDVTTALVDKALASGAQEILFAFQGGEPLLAGVPYYENFTSYVDAHKEDVKVSYSIQTNGVLINDDYIQLFRKYNFLVGVSLDGPKYIHDQNRLSAQGRGTFEVVIANTRKMQEAGIAVNILTVITNESAVRAGKLYRFYKKYGFEAIQFIPCMDSAYVEQGSLAHSLTVSSYYQFLTELFQLWYSDLLAGNYISIRHFDNWVRIMQRRPVDTCALSGQCGSYFVVEANGEVFPCDFYVEAGHLLGNILYDSFSVLRKNLEDSGFLAESVAKRSDLCATCSNVDLCHGGCKRDWVYEGQQGRTRYCEALDRFFTENRSRIAMIAKVVG